MRIHRTVLPLCAVTLIVLLGATGQVEAQTRVAHEAERRAQLHDQSIAAGVLYVSSIVLGTWGLVGGIEVIGSLGGPSCPRCDYSVERAIVLSAIASTAAMGLTLIIAIALNIDHGVRLRALDRELARVALTPGPGDVGLAIAIAIGG
jgi:hypothetical protein